jgi:iron(III) transport system permease protein
MARGERGQALTTGGETSGPDRTGDGRPSARVTRPRRLRVGTGLGVAFLLLFFLAFLLYPLAYAAIQAFYSPSRQGFTWSFMKAIVANPTLRTSLARSLVIGVLVTMVTTVLALPLAFVSARVKLRGKALITGIVLLPMIMPPFVGAIGIKQMFARFGSINTLLAHVRDALAAWGVLSPGAFQPVDWLGSFGIWGVVVLEALHLYPVMYLNVVASLANVDLSLEEAARSLGDSGWHLFRRVTFPLLLPGYFAGAIIIFIWAFTDLGTPLILNYRQVLPVQIFEMVADIKGNPVGYALTLVLLAVTVVAFLLGKRVISRQVAVPLRGRASPELRPPGWPATIAIYCFLALLTGTALLPHIAVALTSVTREWFLTVLPTRYTGEYFVSLWGHEVAGPSIRNSLLFSTLSTAVVIVLGIGIAHILVRKRLPGAGVLDALAMLPLAVPGVVLAFGFLGAYSQSSLQALAAGVLPRVSFGALSAEQVKPVVAAVARWIDPFQNPVPLLVANYAVRRIPYMVRAAYAGFSQVDVSLEEASINLGATPWRTLRRVTIPLVMAHVIAGAVLAFTFAMFEVSSSLILATKSNWYPISRALYDLFSRVDDGIFVACALGVVGMVILAASLLVSGTAMGRRLGELFRVSG